MQGRWSLISIFSLAIILSCQALPAVPELEVTPQDILTDNRFKQVYLDIICTPTAIPSSDSIHFLSKKITQYCHKPLGVISSVTTIKFPEITQITNSRLLSDDFPILSGIWSRPELSTFVERHQTTRTHSSTLVLHIAYLNGILVNEPNIIGLTIKQDTFIVWGPRASHHQDSKVMLHEFGHLLGLVTNPIHSDSNHPPHCSNHRCIMYFETAWGSGEDFDNDCKTDIVTAGGKNPIYR